MFKKIKKVNVMSLIQLYRFISILLTVFIYIIRGVSERYNIQAMLFLIICVVVAAFLLQYLYRKSWHIRARLHLLLFMEILGISFLMLFTGGLKSPFIWCFLNPLLIISYHMRFSQKTMYLVVNFFVLCGIGYSVEKTKNIWEYRISNSNIILSYTLILILVNVVFEYNRRIVENQKQLEAAYKELEDYNRRIKGMTQDILYMYEAVQAIPEQRDKEEIAGMILKFATRVLPQCAAFFVPEGCKDAGCLISSKEIDKDIKNVIVNKIKSMPPGVSKRQVMVHTIKQGLVAAFIGVLNIKSYGTIGLLVSQEEFNHNRDEYEASLLLFSQLGATFFDKIESEFISNELAVADEQNRIAEDIHDSVVQRLFASSCFGYDIINNWDEISNDAKKEQVTLIIENIQSSLKDLRSTIYNLSSKKQEIQFFKESVYNFLKDMERLSNINISMDITGDTDNLSLSAKKALYRIITECTGNAIKHAKCKNIWVNMNISDTHTFLSIRDDGIGLDQEKAEKEKNGLGLYNIKSLVRIFNGTMKINSRMGFGTLFEIVFMNSDLFKNRAKVV